MDVSPYKQKERTVAYEVNDNNACFRDVCIRMYVLKQLEAVKPSDESSRKFLYSIYFEGTIKTAH